MIGCSSVVQRDGKTLQPPENIRPSRLLLLCTYLRVYFCIPNRIWGEVHYFGVTDFSTRTRWAGLVLSVRTGTGGIVFRCRILPVCLPAAEKQVIYQVE